MTWQPIYPDDGPAVYPDAAFRVTLDGPGGYVAQGYQTWFGVFDCVETYAASRHWSITVGPSIEDEDIVEIAIRFTPTRQEQSFHTGVYEYEDYRQRRRLGRHARGEFVEVEGQ